MPGLLVSRKEYDLLVRRCPAWMDLRWREYGRSWFIGGVEVHGTPHAIENLKFQLAWVKALFMENEPCSATVRV